MSSLSFALEPEGSFRQGTLVVVRGLYRYTHHRAFGSSHCTDNIAKFDSGSKSGIKARSEAKVVRVCALQHCGGEYVLKLVMDTLHS